jgi:hypothetical protein
MSEETQPTSDPQPDVIKRPQGQLHDYPVQVRWEVTRRHPYYLMFWSNAALYHQNLLGDTPAQRVLRQVASLMLGAIGVIGEPVSPATNFEELCDGNPDPAFLTGSVQPMTFRAIVAMLINGLPPAERAYVGALLTTGGDHEYAMPGDDDERTAQKWTSLHNLGRTPSPTLDSYPDVPLFYVHLGASQRSIVRDMEDQVRRWKRRRGFSSAKVHTANLEEYLKVWDLREGWTDSAYDRSRELTLAEVGRRLKIGAISTVANRYRSAFEMITGHRFSPELWWRLFGPLKLSPMGGDASQILSAPTRRHLFSPVRRPVPDSVISPSIREGNVSRTLEGGTAIFDDINYRDRLIDLRDLIARGLSDDEIAKRLEIPDPEAVAYFRTRSDGFGLI